MFYPTDSEIMSWMIPFSKLYIKDSYLETRHISRQICAMMCFHCTISTLYSVIQAITSLLSEQKVVMYIPTTFYEFSFILHVEFMAKTVVIKGTISQISLGNTSWKTMANPFHSLQIYWHFCVNTYYISCTSAYTTYWRDGELTLQLMLGQLRIR